MNQGLDKAKGSYPSSLICFSKKWADVQGPSPDSLQAFSCLDHASSHHPPLHSARPQLQGGTQADIIMNLQH